MLSSSAQSAASPNGSPSSNSATLPPPLRSLAGSSLSFAPCLWDLDSLAEIHDWIQTQTQPQSMPLEAPLWTNLSHALTDLHETSHEVKPEPQDDDHDDIHMTPQQVPSSSLMGPPKKRPKRAMIVRTLHDPSHVWLQAWKTNQSDAAQAADSTTTGAAASDSMAVGSSSISSTTLDASSSVSSTMILTNDHDQIPTTFGGKLSQLSIGGWMNAMAGMNGGCVHKTTPLLHRSSTDPLLDGGLSLHDLHKLALTLHRATQTRIRADILRTTPHRIQQLLAAELTLSEFAAVRKRVYETVVLGKGLHANDDDASTDLATAPPGSHNTAGVVESFKKCNSCGNNEQTLFVLDAKNGDVICENCGTVVSESLMHEGSQFRKFEGEVDRNHHGDAWNPLYSNSHNMSTTLGGLQVSGGINGWGAGSKRNLETILRNAHAYTELNVSQFGKTDRKTRTGYKDKQKREAFSQMQHVGDALNLHEAVIQRAKEIFAGFRDDRELLQQFKSVIGT